MLNKSYTLGVFCILSLFQFSCYKKYDLIVKDFYFMRGVLINGYPPIFKLYKNNINQEIEVDPNEVQLEISDNTGQIESMVNGNFSTFTVKENSLCTIKWKLNSSNEWHTLTKNTITSDTFKINPKNISLDNQLKIQARIDSTKTKLFSALRINHKNGNTINSYKNLADLIGFKNETTNKNRFFETTTDENQIILFPPKVRPEYPAQNINYCTKPFNHIKGYFYEDYSIFEMYSKDFSILLNINRNGFNADKPLFIGEPEKFDYKKDEMNAHVFCIHPYEKIVYKNHLPKDGIVTYTILKNNAPLDTIKYTNATLLYSYSNNTKGYSYPYIAFASSGIVFFKDFIANDYNMKFNQSCGYFKEDYNLNISVAYKEFLTGKTIVYDSPIVFYYNYQTDHITINLP